VEVLFSQERVSVISAGLAPGERVLVSDPVPAVEGMLLRPQVDEGLTAAMRAASGQATAGEK
jgi:hypothetical protein